MTRKSRARPAAAKKPAQPPQGSLELLLGWKAGEAPREPVGFTAPAPVAAQARLPLEEPILYKEDRHLLTIAPTGAGKGRSVIITNLLRFEGSVIVIDPKGETWHVTHR